MKAKVLSTVKDLGRTGTAETIPRKPILAVLAFNAALLLAILSLLLSFADYGNDPTPFLLWVCGFAAASVGLVGLSWRRIPRGLRFLGAAVVAMAAVAGLHSAACLLG